MIIMHKTYRKIDMYLKNKENKMLTTTYLKADTITGVYKIDWSDLTESDEITTPVMFQRCLKDLEDGEVLIAAFDSNSEEIYNEINEEYHIN